MLGWTSPLAKRFGMAFGYGSSLIAPGGAKTLVSVSVAPASETIEFNQASELVLTATYDDASEANVTALAVWESSDTDIATVAAGVVTPVDVGTVTITATYGAFNDTAEITINDSIVSIDVIPDDATLTHPDTLQFTAIGYRSSGSSEDRTAFATWASTNLAVATVDAAGFATSVAEGTTNITATEGLIVGSEPLIIEEPADTPPQDGPLSVYVPRTAAHWTNRGIAVPSLQVDCQVLSGNLTALIGALSLVPNGAVQYDQTVSGWTLHACATTEASSSRFALAAGSGPNPATQSVAWLIYAGFSVSAASREFLMAAESTNDLRLDIFGGATPGWRINCNAATTNSVALGYADGIVRPFLFKYNRTAGTVQAFSVKPSDGTSEVINGTYSPGVVDGFKGIGASGSTAPPMRVMLCAAWAGADAEGLSAATLTALGW